MRVLVREDLRPRETPQGNSWTSRREGRTRGVHGVERGRHRLDLILALSFLVICKLLIPRIPKPLLGSSREGESTSLERIFPLPTCPTSPPSSPTLLPTPPSPASRASPRSSSSNLVKWYPTTTQLPRRCSLFTFLDGRSGGGFRGRDCCDARHEVRRDMFEMRLDASRMQRFVMPQEREIPRVVLEMSLLEFSSVRVRRERGKEDRP